MPVGYAPLVFLRPFLNLIGGFFTKKTLSFVLSILLVVGLLSASAGSAFADSAPEAKSLHIVTTIFPFRYLTDDYGLDYYAAFVGCSAETEASFQTIIFLANKLDELGLPAVLQIESADGSIVRTIVENTKSRWSSSRRCPPCGFSRAFAA